MSAEYKKYRVAWYDGREEYYDYFDNDIEAYEHFICKRAEGETWVEELTENGEEYDEIYSYDPFYDEDDSEYRDNLNSRSNSTPDQD
jgi:hypothetical protein